jgi:uncharacterized repeat protein (TIGR01451 family)
MRGFFAVAGVGVLGACLAGWAALGWAQAGPDKPPVPVAGAPAPASSPAPAVPAPVPTPVPGPAALPPLPSAPDTPAAGQGPSLPAQLPNLPGPSSTPMPTPKQGSGAVPPLPAPVEFLPGGSTANAPAPGVIPQTPTPAPAGRPVDVLPGKEVTLPKDAGAAPAIATPAATPARDEQPAESTITPPNPTGRQEPAVSIEWVGPPTAKVGQAAEYTLVVRNACNIPVQQVLVRVRIPAGMSTTATEPKALSENNVLVWDLGTLLSKQEKNLQMKLVADAKGDVMPQAWVTFTGSSVMQVKVREPKLVLKASSPEKVMVGDAAAFTLTVSNPGDGAADQVKIHAVLSDGLEHARGNKVDFEIGNLAAGETRSVQLICATKTGGPQKCEGVAEAEGGLHGNDTAAVDVIMPRLDLQLVGPALRYLERKALYTLKVTNPGDAPATNVTVSDVVPVGFKVLAASDGGRHDFSTRTVSWFLGEIGPGQAREVKLEVQAINPGEHKHKATAVAARGLRAESDLLTRVEGLSALLLEMVDTEDPIEVNGDTAYEIRVTNTGSKTETDIKIIATVPDKMQFKNAQGPVRYHEEGKTIVFEPLERLAPRADAIFRINVKAIDPGTVRFKIQMTSTNLVEPVVKMEATRIYSDAPDAKPLGN